MPNTPLERSTRSNSSLNMSGTKTSTSEAASKNDLKDLKDDIAKIFKSEIKVVTNKLQTLEEKIQSFEASIIAIKTEQERHALQLKTLKEELEKVRSHSGQMSQNEIFEELEERLRRRNSFMVSGISELESGELAERRTHDEVEVTKILGTLDISDFKVAEVRRVGKQREGRPRLTRVTVQDENSRMKILRNAKSLRSSSAFKNIFINPDRTPKEQMRFKELHRELQERRKNGEDVILYRGNVVTRRSMTNFR